MAYCYILYSATRDQYYIGATQHEVSKRIEKHRTGYYGTHHFTAGTDDWEEFITISCRSFSQARKIENHIKRMKSRIYIENLKRHFARRTNQFYHR